MGLRDFFGSFFPHRGPPASSSRDAFPDSPEAVLFEIEKAIEELGAMGIGGIPTVEDWINDKDPDRFLIAYKKMEYDPAVKAAFHSLLFEVASLDLRVQPSDPESPPAIEIAEFIQHALGTVAGGVPRGILIKIMEPALMYQYSISEIVYEQEKRGKWRGKWVLKVLKSKDTRKQQWGFRLDAFRNVISLLHISHHGVQEYHPDKFVHYTFMPMFENPRGISHLRAAYRAWYVKQMVTRAWAFHAQTQGILPVATYKNKAHRVELEKNMAKINARRWMTVPEDVKLEIHKLSDPATSKGHKDIIERLDKQIFLSIKFAFLQALEGDKTGARNMGEVHKDTSHLLPWFLSVDLAEAIAQQIVVNLVKFNFGEEAELPRISLEAPVEEDMLLKAQELGLLVTAGQPISIKQVSETFGWDVPSDDADRLMPTPPALPPSPFDFAGGPDKIDRAAVAADLAAAVNGDSWFYEFLEDHKRA